MKHILKICVVALVAIFVHQNVWSSLCLEKSCADDPADSIFGCETYTCYVLSEGRETVSCAQCKSGYEKVKLYDYTTPCEYSYYGCNEICYGCSGCRGYEDWGPLSTGYETRRIWECVCNQCTKTRIYQCADEYYGTSTNGTSGCTECPTTGGFSNVTSLGGRNTLITDCFLPSGTTGLDAPGEYIYSDICYYSN